MKAKYDLVLRSAHIVSVLGVKKADLAIKSGKIAKIGAVAQNESKEDLNCKGLHILPGIIDSHVHFRESGIKTTNNKQAETLENASKKALVGGVTAFCDMPNCNPVTVDEVSIKAKVKLAEKVSAIDYGFWVGATNGNIKKLNALSNLQGAVGVKLFMGSSTGDLLIKDDETIAKIMQSYKGTLAVHAEDEYRLDQRKYLIENNNLSSHQKWRDTTAAEIAIKRLDALMANYGNKDFRLHILHISSGREIKALTGSKLFSQGRITAEACLHHLTWHTPDVFRRHGNLGQVNPPIRGKLQQKALWKAIKAGLFSTIGSDHAPHLKEAKDLVYPKSPSGSAGVGALLPVMLTHYNRGLLTLSDIANLMSYRPAKILGLDDRGSIELGKLANLTIIDSSKSYRLAEYAAGGMSALSLYHDFVAKGRPEIVILQGKIAMVGGDIINGKLASPL